MGSPLMDFSNLQGFTVLHRPEGAELTTEVDGRQERDYRFCQVIGVCYETREEAVVDADGWACRYKQRQVLVIDNEGVMTYFAEMRMWRHKGADYVPIPALPMFGEFLERYNKACKTK